MWIVRLVDQRIPYGPFEEQSVAARFRDCLTAEVDPAQIEPIHQAAGERLFNPVTELLNWRDGMQAGEPQ